MARLLIGLLIGAPLMTACDSGPEVPDGFTEAAAGPVTFAHPEDWTEGSPTGGADSTLLEYSFDSEGASVHSWDVVAEGPDGEQVILRVAGSEDGLDEDTAERYSTPLASNGFR